MRPDPRAFFTVFGVVWVLLSTLSTAVWWARYPRRGFGRWTLAGLAVLLSFVLASLRTHAPAWVTVVCANNALIVAAMLYVEGAREFRGLPPRRWRDYLGALAAIGVLAFFVYGVPNPNVRTVMGSAYLALMFMLAARILWRERPASDTVALRVMGGLFVLCSVTLLARIGFCTLIAPLNDFSTMTMGNRAFLLASLGEWSLLPVGFFLLADHRAMSDVREATHQVRRADAAVRQHELTEASLSLLSGKVMEAQEQERAQITRTLHDDLAQQAAALAVHLRHVVDRLPVGTTEYARLQHICDATAELGRGIQGVAESLRSAPLELLGLPAAAASLCRELSTRHRVNINCSVENMPEHMAQTTARCLFRVLEDALSNALTHAGGPVTVTLRGTLTDMHLAVIDNGGGFDVEATRENGGVGLLRMRERLRLVGGDLHVESHLGAGTTVRARVPLR
jgi:signal transduction histidine kinase